MYQDDSQMMTGVQYVQGSKRVSLLQDDESRLQQSFGGHRSDIQHVFSSLAVFSEGCRVRTNGAKKSKVKNLTT